MILFDPIGPKLPKPLGSHTKTELDNNLLVIGGISILEPQSAIYSFGCSQGNCIWTTLSQKLSAPRYSAIAMVIAMSMAMAMAMSMALTLAMDMTMFMAMARLWS